MKQESPAFRHGECQLGGVIDKADIEVVHRVKESDDPLKESKKAPMEKSRREKRKKRC